MAQPKKQSSPRKTGLRRSHLLLKLARRVNAKSPVKARTTKRQNPKPVTEVAEKKPVAKKSAHKKPVAKKETAKK
jgi:ribosomal protein L32